MKYLFIIPVCVLVVSAGLWWFARSGEFAVSAREAADSAATAPAIPAHARTDGSASDSARSSEESVSKGPAMLDPLFIAPCTLVPLREQMISSQLDGTLQKL